MGDWDNVKKTGVRSAGVGLVGVVMLSTASPVFAAESKDSTAGTAVSAAHVQKAQGVTRQQKLEHLWELTAKGNMNPMWWKAKWAAEEGHDKYRFDWSTDGCSNAPDSPGGFHFYSACMRHDFGYRNFKKLHAFSKGNKSHVDKTFLDDMQHVCKRQWGPYPDFQRKGCLKVAKKYYQAVVTFGYLKV
ncbi:phospholipase [Streptomyces inhibens]|uniref:phospholipase n=1 Tax=Streptomyces inhibens TaxID=2293571 RepID=UPI001EE70A15|nr:phospholipase [Streptomyces inhibens]UKY54849.1 phospholipase [Streptomyces inhibens]